MGQYFRPVILKKDFQMSYTGKEAEVVLKSYDYMMGAKLMETSYIENPYVAIMEKLLANEFYGYPVVWGGDYAKDIRCFIEGANEEDFVGYDKIIPYDFKSLYAGELDPQEPKQYRYLLNFTRNEYVDMHKLKEPEGDKWVVHPLPLLCADSNGQGGGDYAGKDEKLCGRWAYNEIGVSNELPEGMLLLETDFEDF